MSTAPNEKVTFVLPNGMEVALVPLRRTSLEGIDQWIRARYMRNVMEAVKGMAPELQKEMLFQATDRAAKMSYQNQYGLEVLMESVHGIARVAYELIDSPKITFEQFDKMMFPDNDDILFENYSKVYDMINEVYGDKFKDIFGGESMESEFEEFVEEIAPVFEGEEEDDGESGE